MKNNKAIVITGTSTGIGKACALYLDKMGYKIVLYNSTLFQATAKAIRDAARVLKDGLNDRTKVPAMAEGISTIEQEQMLGLAEDMELEERYRV